MANEEPQDPTGTAQSPPKEGAPAPDPATRRPQMSADQTAPGAAQPRPLAERARELLGALKTQQNLIWLFAPFGALLVLFVLYGLYWSAAARQMNAAVSGWLDARNAEGYAARYDDLSVGGFPFRLEASLSGLVIGAPNTPANWTLETPRALINALPYNPNHLVLRFPEPVIYAATPVIAGRPRTDERRTYTVTSDRTRASARLSEGRIARLSLETANLAALGERRFDDGGTAPLGAFTLTGGEIHARETLDEEGAPAFDLAIKLDAFDWPDAPEGEGPMPTRIDALSLAGRFTQMPSPEQLWSGALPLPAVLAEWSSQNGRLKLAELDLVWADLDIASAGDLGLAPEGTPDGRIDARVKGLGDLIDRMASAERITPQAASAYRAVLTALENGQGTDEQGRLSVPVAFSEGSLYVGPAKVAALPALIPPR